MFVSLKKGVTSTLVYENPNTKETFKVSYNAIRSRKASNLGSRTEGSKTVTQKPDNMLSINKLGSDKAYEFVFDAIEYQKMGLRKKT
ncbi:nuclease domain-containing protein [Clostridium estertheticum]|uniref:nuclease domain-containing protein n=1 Tax=Clostridium estertheticum TaxID=238834 RepID=UPI00299E0760|nr:nuclease domain-containing protein [Clostridium estertheticum]